MRSIRLSFPGTPPPLVAADVHVWLTRLDPCPTGVAGNLTADERERADGYKLPRIRDQFVAARGVLRALLGEYLHTTPDRVTLILDPHGKPVLDSSVLPPFHFNVSHSTGWSLTAVSTGPVGVDLEPVRVVPNADGLVERFFAPEERESYFSLPAEWKPGGFLRGWTCKEAVLKAVGIGMRRMDGCAVEMDPRLPPRVVRFDGSVGPEWELDCWSPCEGFVAAVAVRNESGHGPSAVPDPD